MDGYITIGTKLDTKDFEKEIKYVENQLDEIEYKLKKADMGFEVGDTQKLEMQYEKLSRKLTTLYRKQNDLNKIDLSGAENNIDKVGNSITKVIKRISKWGLAIFGIEGAYSLITNVTNLVAENNEEIAMQLKGIQLFFASAFEPVVTRIVNLVYKLLSYINYIAKAWFNVDLFAKASEKAMQGGVKASKEMKKNLAGFDEMNVVQSNSSSVGGGGIGNIFPTPKDVPIPKWLQWIADNKNTILDFLKLAGILITALQLGKLFKHLDNIFGITTKLKAPFEMIVKFIGTHASLIGGIILILSGLGFAISGIIDYFKNPTWENFGKILLGIGLIAAGVLLIFGGFPALITLIIGAIVALAVAIIKNWDKIKEVLGRVGQWIYDHIIKPIGNFFVGLWEGIVGGVKWAVDSIVNIFWGIVGFFNTLISRIVGFFGRLGAKAGDAIGWAFKSAINGVLWAIENILNFPIRSINRLVDVINNVPGINLGYLPTFRLPRLAKGGVLNIPGRGVPVGGMAIAGEAGQEGVIPLTDEQVMEKLGSSIARRVKINLTDIIQINSRQLAKILKTVQAEDDFAYNR